MNRKAVIDMTRGVPPVSTLPKEKIKRCAEAVMDEFGEEILQYHSDKSKTVQGFDPLIELLAEDMGQAAKPGNILVGNGSLDVFDIIVNSIEIDNKVALVESPSYDRSITTLKRAGAEVAGVPIESDGMDVDELERIARDKNPDLLYTIPDFQNPSGITLTDSKRERVVEIANEYNFWIVEDSPYFKLRYRGEPKKTLWSIDPEKVFYISSFSKLISPGLRAGWTIIPTSMTEKVLKYAEDSYITPGMLSQGVVYEFLDHGWLEPNINQLNDLYRKRLEAILKALERYLPEASWAEPEGGFFVGLYLPEGTYYDDLKDKTEELKLKLSDSRKFFPNDEKTRFVRIPFCSLSPEEIDEGVKRLKKAI